MFEVKKLNSILSVLLITTLFVSSLTILPTDSGVYGAIKASKKKNRVSVTKSVAKKTTTISAKGDRQTVLNDIDNMKKGDSLYLPFYWELFNSKGKSVKSDEFITDKQLSKMITNGTLPSKLKDKFKISKPGKYQLGVAFVRYEWNGKNFKNYNAKTDLYIKYRTVNVYGTVKFKANAKKVKKLEVKSKTVKNGSKYGKLPKPSKKGYKFLGWYTKKKGGKKITAKSKVKMTKSTQNLYAHWKKK